MLLHYLKIHISFNILFWLFIFYNYQLKSLMNLRHQIHLKIICNNLYIFSLVIQVLTNINHQVHQEGDLRWLLLSQMLEYFVSHYLKQCNQNQNNPILHLQIQDLLDENFVIKIDLLNLHELFFCYFKIDFF